jgi:hypothetical protein
LHMLRVMRHRFQLRHRIDTSTRSRWCGPTHWLHASIQLYSPRPLDGRVVRREVCTSVRLRKPLAADCVLGVRHAGARDAELRHGPTVTCGQRRRRRRREGDKCRQRLA